MIKWLTSVATGLFSTAGVALALLPSGVVIDHNLPAELPETGVSTFEITVHKGALDYFGRLQFDLPEGVELHPLHTQGGSFSTNNQEHTAIISWLSLPEADPFTVRLELDASAAVYTNSSVLAMPWQFAFVENNARQLVELDPIRFRVGGVEAAAADVASAVEDEVASSHEVVKPSGPSCVRTITELASGQGFLVRLEVKSLHEGQFSKLTETLPLGCDAMPRITASSICTQAGQNLQFMWFYSPVGEQLLEYTLPHCTLSSIEELSGILSFVEGDISHEVPIIELGKTELTSETLAINEMVAPETGVSYRVQIAAGHSEMVTDYFTRMFDFAARVTVEQHEGWLKYTTGAFGHYNGAKNERQRLTELHDFRGPFVAAYQDGERITVQHALTLTGCGWTQ
jgi:hypothetical protein